VRPEPAGVSADEACSRASEALTPEIDPLVLLPTPNDQATMHYIGMGSRATLRAALEAVLVLVDADEPINVQLGPMDADWMETVAAIGFLARGRLDDVNEFGRRLAKRLRYPGVVAQPWQVSG